MQLRAIPAKAIHLTTIAVALLGVIVGWFLRGWSSSPPAPIIPTASAAPPPSPSADPLGPFHGLSPVFTTRPLESCGTKLGQFCPYESCSASYPLTGPDTKYVLWSASVTTGLQGPQVVCEWRHL